MDSGLKLAKVTSVHPSGYSVDVVLYSDGSRFSNVQVLSGTASTSTGFADLPKPDKADQSNEWSMQDSKTKDMIAVVGFIAGAPVCLGFLFPQVNQMLFDDGDRMIYRHASDVYFTIDKSGNTELFHPSGAFIRLGASGSHEDLTGKDFDGNFKISKNTSTPVKLHVEQAGGKASVDIDTDGTITMTSQATVNIQASGDINLTSTTLKHNGKNVGSTHVHSGVQSGPSNTGVPV